VAQTYALEAQARTVTGKKVGKLRREGLIPAVIYGVKIQPVHIQVPFRTLQTTLLKAGGTHLIDISVAGTPYSVLARVVQRDILKGDIIHVDFMAVDASTVIEAQVPISFVNEAPAERAGLGILLQGLQKVTIAALPANLIDRVEVDLSGLAQIGDTIYVRDLKVSDKVKIVDDGDDMVAKIIVTAAAESELAAEEAATSAEPEVIGKGKKDEEEIED
jgi:large subunit ribosomal protein L25